MRCQHCGQLIPDNATHCPHCQKTLVPGEPDISTLQTAPPEKELPFSHRTRQDRPGSGTYRASGNGDLPDTTGKEEQTIAVTGSEETILPPPPTTAPADIKNEEAYLRHMLQDRYDIKKRLGKGNMGEVYLAREMSLDRNVAIKVLPCRHQNDREFISRFKREARLAAKLEHPSIVRIFQINEEFNICYIVMSFIPGGTLSSHLATHGKLAVDQAIIWAMDIASALAYAHDQGIVHRDLKPDNIMIDKNTRAVVMDFGIARANQDPCMTFSGQIIGTPRYMSPEQALGKEADERSDIYSMGLILYEMLTNNFPFEATDLKSYINQHTRGIPRPPRETDPSVPRWLNDIIMKCLEKEPRKRFASARELRKAFAAQRELTTPVTPLSSEPEDMYGSGSRTAPPWTPMQKYDIDPDVIHHVQQVIGCLPDIPANARRLIKVISNEEADSRDIARIASSDPVLVSTILGEVNSSYYGLARKTSNLHFAIVRLGLNEIKRLVFRHLLNDQFRNEWQYEGYSTRGLWFHSYTVSVCAEHLAKLYLPRQVGNMVTYGIMHDIGKFALFNIAMLLKKRGIALKPPTAGANLTMMQREEILFRVNHGITGGLLAERWQLPDHVCSIIEHHHNPSYMDIGSIPDDILAAVTLVNIADTIVHIVTGNAEDAVLPEIEFFELLNLPYPLVENITPALTEKITGAMEFVKSMA